MLARPLERLRQEEILFRMEEFCRIRLLFLRFRGDYYNRDVSLRIKDQSYRVVAALF